MVCLLRSSSSLGPERVLFFLFLTQLESLTNKASERKRRHHCRKETRKEAQNHVISVTLMSESHEPEID